jgi:hypothetical protein
MGIQYFRSAYASPKWKINFLYLTLFLTFSFGESTAIFAQCDNSLIPSTNDLISYQYRQNRCEGFYIAQVSGKSEVVGFVKGLFNYALNPNEQVEITTETPNEIHIRAVGIPLTLYYRMDGKASKDNSLTWKIGDVLFRGGIPSYNIGIYGWMQEGLKILYLPVQSKATIPQPKTDDTYRIYLRSSTKLSDLRWRVLCSASNITSQYQRYGNGNIMAGEPIVIEFPPNISGDCILEIAKMRHGTSDFEIDKIHFRI